MTSRTLLAHVVSKFAPRQWENVATESLHYLLDRPAGGAAVNSLLAPLGFDPGPLVWRAQASSIDDSSIPDLVGNDAQNRHVLIVEGKFWASLTENQPLGYLARQALQFPDPARCRLLFLVPRRRENVITAELEQRLEGGRHSRVGPFPVITDPNGRRVVVVLWSQMLSQLQLAFEAAHDSEAVDDLAQLRGLCDRGRLRTDAPHRTRGDRLRTRTSVLGVLRHRRSGRRSARHR